MEEKIKVMVDENPQYIDKDIANALGTSRSNVQRIRSNLGITRRQLDDNIDGRSTLYKIKGKERVKILEWVKHSPKGLSAESFLEKLDSCLKKIRPLPIGQNEKIELDDSDIMTVIPITDLHLGMKAPSNETDEPYDMSIAVSRVKETFSNICSFSGTCHSCLLVILGDFFHRDGIRPMTTRNGHLLDVDSNWNDMFETGIVLMIDLINILINKYSHVSIKACRGNHDDISIIALMQVIKAFFRTNPNVDITVNFNNFSYIEFGSALLGINHGVVGSARLPMIMAKDVPDLWGRTRYRYWMTGHKHSKKLTEYPGCLVECFRALSINDIWSYNSGFRSSSELVSIILHKEKGEISRTTMPL